MGNLTNSMMSNSLFHLLFKLRVCAGLFTVESTNKPKLLMYVYLIGWIVIFFTQIICQIFVISFKFSLGDGSDALCVSAMFLLNCIIIILNLWRGSKAEGNYKETVRVVDAILELNNIEFSLQSLKKYVKILSTLITIYVNYVVLLQIIQVFIKALSFLKVIDLVPDHYLWIYAMPWPVNSYTYWPTLTLEALSTLFMIIIQQVNIYFIISMMVLQTLGLKHLRTSLAEVIRLLRKETLGNSRNLQLLKPLYVDEREAEQYERLKSWIKLHSELINLCKEFDVIYTPMFLSYFLVIFGILLTAVFALLQNANYFGAVEATLLALYFSGIIFNVFVLSLVGSNLTFESLRTFEEAFQAPWYNCSPRVKSSLRIICTAAKRPIIVSVFGSDHFTLSLQTFIWVMRTMVSVYIGLAEVKRRSEAGV